LVPLVPITPSSFIFCSYIITFPDTEKSRIKRKGCEKPPLFLNSIYKEHGESSD
jgi:hypothetical protein